MHDGKSMGTRISAKNNFAYLTAALVMLLFTSALVEQFTSGQGLRLIEAATVLTLAVGVWSIRGNRTWFRTGIGFGIGVFAITLLSTFMDLAGLGLLHLGLMLGFFSLTTWLAARQVLESTQVDGNKIIGAVCLYLLLGMIWAVLYLMAAELQPASFKGLGTGPWDGNFGDMVYFSFVTLSTLGYGDITPALPLPKFLVYMEAIVGQFYLAILVASLVGIRISLRMQDD